MIPVIAIVGRPNLGKSTLFNYLTRSRSALVADEPGVTRDRQYGEGHFADRPFIVIDTAGMQAGDENSKPCHSDKQTGVHGKTLEKLMEGQSWLAISESQLIFWVVDARQGLTAIDREIAQRLRLQTKPIFIVVNKSDGLQPDVACADFFALGMKFVFPISAVQGQGITALMEKALSVLPVSEERIPETSLPGIKVAIVGRPNVGKSTLVNRILGEERVLVFDAPGTTRESVFIPFARRDKNYVIIDTAGVRRRRSVEQGIEKFSVVKTLQAVSESNVVVFVLDARQGVAEQDLHLLGFVIEAGKSLVIAVNKWDDLTPDVKNAVCRDIDRRLKFVAYARVHFISALHGSGVGELFSLIEQAYACATKKLTTHQVTEILEQALELHQPPAVMGRRIKLRYAHVGGYNPPVIVIHGNQTDALPLSYQRYLANFFRQSLKLVGTPLCIALKSGNNPFKDRKNELTERQIKRRKRLVKHVKRMK